MVVREFPPIETADEDGLLAMGGDLDVETLLLAYSQGIFPWPFSPSELAWFSPPKRAILMLRDFHVSRSLQKTIKQEFFEVRFDTDFREIISNCSSQERPGQVGTWITSDMIDAYTNLFNQGNAFCVGAYNNQQLAGGVYGVRINRMYAAESMYFHEPNASKVALYHLVEKLQSSGITWIDCQVINPFLEKLGVREISRSDFLLRLQKSLF